MPIIIPSKHIYGDPSIDTVKKNKIDSVEFQYYSAVVNAHLNENVYNDKVAAEANTLQGSTVYDFGYAELSASGGANQAVSATKFTPYYSRALIRIPIVQKRKTVTDVFGGKNGDEYKISASFSGWLEKGTVSCDIDFDNGLEIHPSDVTWNDMIDDSTIAYHKESEDFVESHRAITNVEPYKVEFNPQTSATSKVEVETDDREETITTDEEDGTIDVDINILYSGYFLTRIGGKRIVGGNPVTEYYKEVFGEYEKFTPTRANISINGDFLVLDLTETTQRFGNGENVFEVSGNELMQDKNTLFGEDYPTSYSNRILEQYKNGKGVAEIRCDIFPVLVGATQTDFETYDTETNGITIEKSGNSLVLNGTAIDRTSILVSRPSLKADRYIMEIPTHQGVEYALAHGEFQATVSRFGDKNVYVDLQDFEDVEIFVHIEEGTSLNNYVVGDIVTSESLIIPVGSSVIPMYRTASGDDYPMFSKSGGQPKPCIVVGAEVYYDGAVMQRLTIKEM